MRARARRAAAAAGGDDDDGTAELEIASEALYGDVVVRVETARAAAGDAPAGGSSAHVEALGARGGDGDDGGSDDDATDGGGDDGGDPVHADALALRLARFLPPADSTTAGAGDGYSNP